ncbi:HlyD family efflux transporter periplasmic adaptor subunit [Atlantibacter subterraneus]|jgi:membrane fusion protein, adhesin transport system|uniref:HlyD family efflux transporter periplasmic adaptor subunit n=2 Tax=Atlantibacter subterraneus TaxID=255519 RepID=A0ABU4E2H2_9ENTR|nr:HlyD family efflux transporter periplasmic adaptor subunit [Atlantibacter subterranea]MDZ5666411.1 HlyD family efflux transporter periplasmic adaptor subunit [Atlantibacter hermannii]QFH68307.1 HlyD family efflux transporter periplasmic adaptor subunit [Enterobacter sp. E76]MDV7023295.1 HlyD family efflux transporter periplasmic adaptor subunit [Atlantibacter subterranea]MDW2744230.1 HlyD family efflux transporter periplasmic adaptor subunit [Atlantibacter subterranea]TSJ56799.1 HlyD family
MSQLTLEEDLARQGRFYSSVIWLSLIGLVVFFAWAWFAMLDEVTVGTGKVTPSSHAQVIESLDGGIVNALLVQEGDIVEQGQMLARLDPTRFQSNYGEAAARARALRASSERLRAELTGEPLKFSAESMREPNLVARERQLYESRRRNLNETVSNLQKTLELINAEIRMTQPLVAKGAAGQVEVIRLQRQVAELRGKIDEARNQYAVRAREEQVKNDADLDAQIQAMAGKADQLDRATLYSPVRGVVKDIQVTTVGGVLQPGGKLMEIVPLEDKLLIETRINPRDIAYIRPGLPATVKVTAYDSSIYGNLDGKVEIVSPDTLQDEVQRDQFYYRVYVRTDHAELENRSGKRFPILPGMVASVEIKTGQKTVLDYLIKPLNKVKEALRER